jgi:hypothetical protein
MVTLDDTCETAPLRGADDLHRLTGREDARIDTCTNVYVVQGVSTYLPEHTQAPPFRETCRLEVTSFRPVGVPLLIEAKMHGLIAVSLQTLHLCDIARPRLY